MATVKDIILNEENDLIINETGDFLIKESDQQHIVLIINTFIGDWKNHPYCGVGIIRYLSASGQHQTLRRNISVQLEADGYNVNDVVLKGNQLYYVNAERVIK